MNVWLVRISEPLPKIDGENVRLLRMGLLAEYLASKGHDVCWWTSDHNHAKSINRFNKDHEVVINPSLRIKLITTIAYKKRISFRRFINHYIISKKFIKQALPELKKRKPDIVVVSLPVIEVAEQVVNLCNKNNIPVVVDYRDMWPEVFVNRIFPNYKNIGRAIFYFQFKKMKVLSKRATAIWAITNGFLEWALSYAGRPKCQHDKYFYLSNKSEDITEFDSEFWKNKGVDLSEDVFKLVYVGNFSSQVCFDLILPRLEKLKIKYQLIIAGSGDTEKVWKDISNENVIFSGWINRDQIASLYNLANVGLVPYYSTEDFKISIPNKVIEYLSYGLPVLTTLDGILREFLIKNECGEFLDVNAEDFIYKFENKVKKLKSLKSSDIKSVYKKNFDYYETYNRMENSLLELVDDFK